MKVYIKSMEIHEHVWDIFVLKREDGLYFIFQVNGRLPYLSSKEKMVQQRKQNPGFPENMDFDLQITGQNYIFDDNLKLAHNHYGHFAPSGFP